MKEHLRRYINNMKLEKKLLISYLLFAVIPMLLIGIVICIASFRIIIRQTREYADIMIERINHDVDGFVRILNVRPIAFTQIWRFRRY